MKKFMALGLLCAMCCACNTNGDKAGVPSMKVVVKDSEVLGRFVEEKDDSYVIDVQDVYEIPKEGVVVEEWTAADGKGVVYLKECGKAKAYDKPDDSGETIGEICYEEGYVPDTYFCLGYENGWFKIDLNGIVAYVSAAGVIWDAIDSF